MIRVCEQGGARNRVVDSYLGRETGIAVLDTNRQLARHIGNLLARAAGVPRTTSTPPSWPQLSARAAV